LKKVVDVSVVKMVETKKTNGILPWELDWQLANAVG
jgi:hypothetical protein